MFAEIFYSLNAIFVMKEIWRPIKGYETYYEVSNLGRVRSVDRIVAYSNGIKCLHKGRILKPYKDARENKGYLRVELKKYGIFKKFAIHRLVAQAFLPNPDNLPQVNHKDEDKTNNFIFLKKDGSVDLDKSNLEWCTQAYNNSYGTRLKRQVEKRSMPVLQIDKETNEIIAVYPSMSEAARHINGSQGSIWNACNNTQKTAYGYKWEYKKE